MESACSKVSTQQDTLARATERGQRYANSRRSRPVEMVPNHRVGYQASRRSTAVGATLSDAVNFGAVTTDNRAQLASDSEATFPGTRQRFPLQFGGSRTMTNSGATHSGARHSSNGPVTGAVGLSLPPGVPAAEIGPPTNRLTLASCSLVARVAASTDVHVRQRTRRRGPQSASPSETILAIRTRYTADDRAISRLFRSGCAGESNDVTSRHFR